MRSVTAIVAGLGFMAATVTVGTLVASTLVGGQAADGRSSDLAVTASLYANLLICGVGGILGGWLAARIAPYAPYGHAAAMAAIVAVLAIGTATDAPASAHPGWYPSALSVAAVLGILLGGKLRAAAESAGPAAAHRA
jgi:hypothetical protein